jgi:hypothetical protein
MNLKNHHGIYPLLRERVEHMKPITKTRVGVHSPVPTYVLWYTGIYEPSSASWAMSLELEPGGNWRFASLLSSFNRSLQLLREFKSNPFRKPHDDEDVMYSVTGDV